MTDDLTLNMDAYLPLRDVVFNTLREAILKGELKPGERLMELQLAAKLGVSRTPIREAIRMLEQEGLAVTIPRKGAEVAKMTEKDMEDVLQIRDALDELAASIACEQMTKEQLFHLAKEYSHEKNRFFFLYIYTVFTCTCISVPCHVFCYGSHSVLRTYPLYFLFQPYLRRSLEQNIRFMVHDTCKYPDHDCIFPALYRSIWLLVSCRV